MSAPPTAPELVAGLQRIANGPHLTTCPRANQAQADCRCPRAWAAQMLDRLGAR